MLFKTVLLAVLATSAQAARQPVLYNCECRVDRIFNEEKTSEACRRTGQMRNNVCVVMYAKLDKFACPVGSEESCIKRE
ncbi:hypothetical protein LZ31DRAFT_271084 [Colletotrichum somersetense]|nr:hypothetical protein LZ31DRAFT_271084 [Colletotrichum somersetense]